MKLFITRPWSPQHHATGKPTRLPRQDCAAFLANFSRVTQDRGCWDWLKRDRGGMVKVLFNVICDLHSWLSVGACLNDDNDNYYDNNEITATTAIAFNYYHLTQQQKRQRPPLLLLLLLLPLLLLLLTLLLLLLLQRQR